MKQHVHTPHTYTYTYTHTPYIHIHTHHTYTYTHTTHTTHTYTHTYTHRSLIILANSIHSSMNISKAVNEYFTKPTSVRNKPGYKGIAVVQLFYQFRYFVK